MINNLIKLGRDKPKLRPHIRPILASIRKSSIGSDLKNKYPEIEDLWISKRDDIAVLNKIIIREDARGQGIGSKVMKDIIDWADQNKLILATTPSEDFGGSKSNLERFYKRFDFVENKGADKIYRTNETFIRKPK